MFHFFKKRKKKEVNYCISHMQHCHVCMEHYCSFIWRIIHTSLPFKLAQTYFTRLGTGAEREGNVIRSASN